MHDPKNPSLRLLQQPAEALMLLPSDPAGNQVDWVAAIEDGYIKPRDSMLGYTDERLLDTDILMKDTGDSRYVLFPHLPHTYWLGCDNCHESIFKSKVGETPINMLEILQGKYCGQCHGAVSFPLTECNRCHSVTQEDAKLYESSK